MVFSLFLSVGIIQTFPCDLKKRKIIWNKILLSPTIINVAYIIMIEDGKSSVKSLLQQLADIFQKKSWTLAVAESCTGGLLGDIITGLTGSSKFFHGGVIAYSNQVKINLLKVSSEFLKENGAVGPEVALSMARGIRKLLGSSVGVAITGIAGPGGGSREKPVGLVYIAVITPEVEVVERFAFSGKRHEIKTRAAETAVEMLIQALEMRI
jgi:nicotinamide-nucleotide amidase